MEAAAHDPDFAKRAGVPTSVAKDFVEADLHHPRVCCNGHVKKD